jgi:hypothetical protein
MIAHLKEAVPTPQQLADSLPCWSIAGNVIARINYWELFEAALDEWLNRLGQ